MSDAGATEARVRREPPPFRAVRVLRRTELGPRMVRLTLAGPELEGFPASLPGASVRLLAPPAGATEVVRPTWDGNVFLMPDGSRAQIRTYTPRRLDPDGPEGTELDVDVVLHGPGAIAGWAAGARPGDAVAVAGPGRGYTIDPDAWSWLLVGDESALPAVGQLLEALPAEVGVDVHVEVVDADGRIELPSHPGARVHWHEQADGEAPGRALVAAVTATPLEAGSRVWAAGEAAAMQAIRAELFTERGLPRSDAVVRGYWKAGRVGDADEG